MRAKVHKEYTSIVYNHIRYSDMKGSIQMKKHYILLSVVITTLILLLFGGVGVWYTYETATNIMDEKWLDVISNRTHYALNKPLESDGEIVADLYCDSFNPIYRQDDIGAYEVYISDAGKKYEIGNYIWVSFYDPDSRNFDYDKFISVGPDFKLKNRKNWNNGSIEELKIDAMCDENFIFNGTIEATDTNDEHFKYTIGKNELVSDENTVHINEAVHINEFLKQRKIDVYQATCYALAETKREKKLCDEAKKKLEDTLAATKDDSWFKEYSNSNDDYYYYSLGHSTDEDEYPEFSYSNGVYNNENVVVHAQKNLETSFYITHHAINSDTDNVYSIFLFHPLKLALRYNMKIYIISLLVLIILEVLVIFFIRKLYRNGRDYELLRQGLTRSIAHDLKTPLAITKAYVENWEYIDEADRHEHAEKLNLEVDHMTYIINTMLNMSRFDLKKSIKLEEVNIHTMTMTMYERMKPLISERKLDVRIYTDNENGDYYAYADPKMIRIVINNFLTNAVKYAKSTIYLEFYNHRKKIKFVIGNDGTTISKKDIKKIWEPFYKADKTRTDRIGSSGMGLAINKSILELHKAKFKCTSNAGRTTFSFEMKKVGNNGK